MGRQEKPRTVESPPIIFRFSPDAGKTDAGQGNGTVGMSLDEFEAIRLADKIGYEHAQAAEIMGISRPTFTRLVSRARAKVAEFIVDGRSLEISGGAILFSDDVYCCKLCHRPFRHEGKETLECPVCGNRDIIKARSDCNGDCRCCEENGACG